MSTYARRTNTALGFLSGAVLLVTTGSAIFGDTSPKVAAPTTSTSTTTSTSSSSSSTSTTIVDDGDYVDPFDDEFEIFAPGFTVRRDKTVSAGTTYWLDGSIPTRTAAVLPTEFTYGRSSTTVDGMTEPEANQHDFPLKATGPVTCPASSYVNGKPENGTRWSRFETCSVMTSESGQFLVVARSAWLNNMDKRLKDAIKIEIFVPRKFSDGSRRAVQVLSGYFGQSLCAGRRYITVGKAKVGRNDVLVVTDNYNFFTSTHTTVIAMNSSGMPVVVASYLVETGEGEQVELAATDRSLVILNGRIGDPDDENPEEYTLTELIPRDTQWLERVHIARSPADPIVTAFQSSPKPHNILEYDFRMYDDERSDDWCARQN